MFFHRDIMVNNKNQVQFLPGQLVYNEERDKMEIVPGMIGEADTGDAEFIEGRFMKKGGGNNVCSWQDNSSVDWVANRFETANNKQYVALQKSPFNTSTIFKKHKASPGHGQD